MLCYRQGTDYLDYEIAVLVLVIRAVCQVGILTVQGEAQMVVSVSFLENILDDTGGCNARIDDGQTVWAVDVAGYRVWVAAC